MVTRGDGGWVDKLAVWDEHVPTTVYKVDKQQRPTAQHRELYSMSYNNLQWKRI